MRDSAVSDGERRWTAVLMADMAGSTAITQQIGTEKAYQILTRLIGMAIKAVEAEGGTALTFGGDSLLAAFGAPIAVEDASLRACRAALAFQAALAQESDAIKRRFGFRPEFRIGISGGMVVVGNLGPQAGMDRNIMGQPVNTAARLQELAAPGQILLSAAMFEQVAGEVECTDLGPQSLKGIAGQSKVFALHKTLDASERFAGRIRRGLVDMVGRRKQLDAVRHAIDAAGQGWQLLLVEGPPGIGKSRLLHDLRLSLQGERHVVQGQCRAGSQAPYQPLLDVLLSIAGVDPSEGAEAVLAGLAQNLGSDLDLRPLRHVIAPNTESASAPVGSNFALALRETLRQALERVFAKEPSLLVIEDAHWIDGSTRSLLDEMLLPALAQAMPCSCPILLTTRREGVAHWAQLPPIMTLHLTPLNYAETRDLASRRVRNAVLAPALAQRLFEKSEGNPLFIEEIMRYLGSIDALIESPEGLTIKQGQEFDLTGGNLEHLIMARVDALPAATRQTLRYAAVQGRQFRQDVLQEVQPGQDLPAQLAEAADRGLIEPLPGGSKTQWRFRHALLRDAIYSSLLEDNRLPMHHTIGSAIEKLNLGPTEDISETLAFHYVAASEPKLAAPHLIQSARKALQVYDLNEVDRLLRLVRDMLHNDPALIDQRRIDRMAVVWLEAMVMKGAFSDAIDVGREFLPKLRAGGNERAIEIAVSHYATALAHARDYPQAIELALNGIAQAQKRGDTMSAAWLHLPLLRAYEETNALSHSAFMELTNQTLHTAETLGETRLKMQVIYLQAANYRSNGRINLARNRNAALRDYAISQTDKRAQGFAAWAQALLLQISEEHEAAVKLAEESQPLTLPGTADAHVLQAIWVANTVLGRNPTSARAALDDILSLSRGYMDYNIIQGCELIDAVYHLRLGKIAKGWALLCKVIDETRDSGNVTFSRYFHLVRAEILLKIAGLSKEPPLSADYPDRSIVPPPKLGVKDILTVLKLRLRAKKLAAADLVYFRNNFSEAGLGVHEARVLTCEALLTRDRSTRTAMLQQAAKLAQDEGLKILQHRIEAQI
jgi:class 3 adenylate cyclase